MYELTRSLARFAWTTSVAGAEQLLRPGRVAPALEAATWASWGELEEMLQLAYLAGCDLQDDGLELAADVLRPWHWRRAAERLARRSLDAARFVDPSAGGTLARREWRNKFDVFWRVKGVRRDLGHPPPPARFDLAEYVERAYGLGAFPALWAIEGLGHDYAATLLDELDAGGLPAGILTDPALAGLPASSAPMLHGGLGLALAERLLRPLTPRSSAAEFRGALRRFVELCRAHSRPAHLISALESFGLEARCFFAQLVPGLERELEAAAGEAGEGRLAAIFWHGVGRALYFIPVQFVPGWGTVGNAVAMAQREAPHELARHNALAGLAYAFAMVNMSQPRILEALLRDRGETLRGTAWSDGLAAAVQVRGRITPGAPVLAGFLDHRPRPDVEALWDEMVRRPGRRALAGALQASTGDLLYAVLEPAGEAA
jgi:hypothetical protein